VLGRELRQPRELDGGVDVERVAHPHVGGVDQRHDVARERLVDRLALLTEQRVRVLGGERPPGRLVGHDHAPLEPARTDPHERHPVAVRRVHVRLHLEHERRERVVELAGRPVHVEPGHRRRRQLDDAVEQRADPEVGERRTDEHRRLHAGQEQIGVDRTSHALEERHLVPCGPPRFTAGPASGVLGIDDLLDRSGGPVRSAPVAQEATGPPVDQAPEVTGDADRPGHRHRLDVEPCLDLVEELQPVAPRPVPLVEEREQGHVARPAHLEQLERLRLDALGGIQHHDGGVDGRKHAIRVLGEVAVTRSVEQVQHVAAVGELQDGRRDGDATPLLELHPVGPGAAPLTPGPDLTGLLNRPAVEEELLGERGLARVGVADDGERAAARRAVGEGLGHAEHRVRAPGEKQYGSVGPASQRSPVHPGAVPQL
jgi:hypothetical protein